MVDVRAEGGKFVSPTSDFKTALLKSPIEHPTALAFAVKDLYAGKPNQDTKILQM